LVFRRENSLTPSPSTDAGSAKLPRVFQNSANTPTPDAISGAIGPDMKIVARQQMASLAMLSEAAGLGDSSPDNVFLRRHWLQMEWVHAGCIPADVVHLHTVGNRADEQLVTRPVSQNVLGSKHHPSILSPRVDGVFPTAGLAITDNAAEDTGLPPHDGFVGPHKRPDCALHVGGGDGDHSSYPSIDSAAESRHAVLGLAVQPTFGPPERKAIFSASCPQSGSRQRQRLADHSTRSDRIDPHSGQVGVSAIALPHPNPTTTAASTRQAVRKPVMKPPQNFSIDLPPAPERIGVVMARVLARLEPG
jgi:hypothetical protein